MRTSALAGLALAAALASGLACTSTERQPAPRSVTPAEAPEPAPAPREAPTPAASAPPARPVPADLSAITPRQQLEDPGGAALDGFFAALARTEAGEPGALTRVSHFGDSSIGRDGLPHALRSRLQARFGDGGAGFVLPHEHSNNVYSEVVRRRSSGAWSTCYIAYGCQRSGRYGYGGHVNTIERGAVSSIATLRDGPLATSVARFELWYAAGPRGGQLSLRVDSGAPEAVDTRAPAPEDRWHAIDVEPGAHALEIRAVGAGSSRIYGVVLEREGPGVVWDTMSMTGTFTRRLLLHDADHIARQVARRDPDLVVFNFGGNDLRRFVYRSVTRAQFFDEVRASFERLLAGKHGVSCLVIGINDHARSGKRDVRPEHVAAVVEVSREVAYDLGCAFFDSVEAMGGPGSIREWRRARPPLAAPDLKHLTARGRDVLGGMIHDALMARYAAWRGRARGDTPGP